VRSAQAKSSIAAPAADIDETRYYEEIKSCIAEVGDRANYTDATRVRHTVVEKNHTRLGYVFVIDTAVYSDLQDEAIRTYASQCVARGKSTLVKFTINEV
jgi:hypothetical protein